MDFLSFRSKSLNDDQKVIEDALAVQDKLVSFSSQQTVIEWTIGQLTKSFSFFTGGLKGKGKANQYRILPLFQPKYYHLLHTLLGQFQSSVGSSSQKMVIEGSASMNQIIISDLMLPICQTALTHAVLLHVSEDRKNPLFSLPKKTVAKTSDLNVKWLTKMSEQDRVMFINTISQLLFDRLLIPPFDTLFRPSVPSLLDFGSHLFHLVHVAKDSDEVSKCLESLTMKYLQYMTTFIELQSGQRKIFEAVCSNEFLGQLIRMHFRAVQSTNTSIANLIDNIVKSVVFHPDHKMEHVIDPYLLSEVNPVEESGGAKKKRKLDGKKSSAAQQQSSKGKNKIVSYHNKLFEYLGVSKCITDHVVAYIPTLYTIFVETYRCEENVLNMGSVLHSSKRKSQQLDTRQFAVEFSMFQVFVDTLRTVCLSDMSKQYVQGVEKLLSLVKQLEVYKMSEDNLTRSKETYLGVMFEHVMQQLNDQEFWDSLLSIASLLLVINHRAIGKHVTTILKTVWATKQPSESGIAFQSQLVQT
eukprot:TRINITY_DN158_c0_g1_i13.p1 TRINITY_DN158_c0_g1~~TRINITY_DN158_c0_g1_i13.p1  ORF type:complete len:526 (+),score=139.82 TRINITY_DN158_c0_g1_i13:82-1659(+)